MHLICVRIMVFYAVSLTHYVFPDSVLLTHYRFFPVAMPAQLGEMGSTWLRINPCLSPGSIRQKQQRQIIHSVPSKEWQKSPWSCLDRCLLRKGFNGEENAADQRGTGVIQMWKGKGTTWEGCTVVCALLRCEQRTCYGLSLKSPDSGDVHRVFRELLPRHFKGHLHIAHPDSALPFTPPVRVRFWSMTYLNCFSNHLVSKYILACTFAFFFLANVCIFQRYFWLATSLFDCDVCILTRGVHG